MLTGVKRNVYYCKGHFFKLSGGKGLVKKLIYPAPSKTMTTLGFHLTLDLEGEIRFGPDAHFQNDLDYSFIDDPRHLLEARESVAKYLDIGNRKIQPDYTGIRPKIVSEGSPAADFRITMDRGYIELMGIESPGLTSSLAIGDYVASLL